MYHNSRSLIVFVYSYSNLILNLPNGVCAAALQSVGIKNSLYEIPGLGNRPIIIKVFPAIENIQSKLFEISIEPYSYGWGARMAVAIVEGESGNGITGELLFFQEQPPIPTLIQGNITGLPSGIHGFHISQSGDLRGGCGKLEEHFNPYFFQHGGPTDPLRHVGDLGNIEADEGGNSEVYIIDPLISLFGGPRGVVGRAIVITSDADNLGRGNTATSLTTGDSGSPIACGIIAYIR